MEVTAKFLEMLLAGASREDLDLVVAEAEVSGSAPEQLDALREQHALALRIHELMARQRSREAELTALYETARDLTAIRDLDAILAAIVRRARQLLGADMTYLSLNDEAEGASYMKVTDGALTPEFRSCGCRSAPGCSGWWRSRERRTSPRTTRPTSASCIATTSTPPWRASRSARSSASRSPWRGRSSARCWRCTARSGRSRPARWRC